MRSRGGRTILPPKLSLDAWCPGGRASTIPAVGPEAPTALLLLAAFLSIVGEILKRLTMSKSPKKKKHVMDDDDMEDEVGYDEEYDDE